MNSALVAKLRAKIGKRATGGDPQSLLRFLRNKNEKKFVTAFLHGIEHDSKDFQYYMNLWNSTKQLDKPHRKAMQHVLGTEIDLQNILWTYRLKKFYGIFGDTTYGFLVPVRHRLPADIFLHMVSSQNVNSMQSILSNTVYHHVFGDFSNAQECLSNAVKARYRAEMRRSHVALLCGYLYEYRTPNEVYQ